LKRARAVISMSKLKTIIVDDEPLALELLRSILGAIDEIEIIAECSNGRDAIAAASSLHPDLIFLDIQMPGVNGFEVVKAMQSDTMPMVIFATAYNQFAIDAFDMHAVDYVLKPLDPERIERAVQRALERHSVQDEGSGHKMPLIGAIDEITKRLNQEAGESTDAVEELPEGIKRKLLIRDSGVVKVVPFDDIDWVDAAGDYMCVHALGETHIVRSTLRELLEKLDEQMFIRIHRSTVVNIERVVRVKRLQKGGSLLHLADGNSLRVSRNYREAIRSLFQ
jgi:two-component system, LytTR family, response regulator